MSGRLHVDDLVDVACGAERVIEGQRCFGRVAAAMFGQPARVTVGRYELLDRLGAGGSGVVYRARDPELRREVALKIVGVRSVSARQRVIMEGQALARVVHPAVVTVYDVGETSAARLAPWVSGSLRSRANAAYVVMELVEGPTLDEWASQRTADEVVQAVAAAARGLAAAHRQDVVHGDFKPSNVLVHDGQPRVIDWGLSVVGRHGETGQGTPEFMAPELEHGPATPATDQYALCWALQQLVPSPPERARLVIRTGLQTDPNRRYPSLDAVADALERREYRRAAVVAMGVVALAGWAGTDSPATPQPESAALIPIAWSDARRRDLGALLGARLEPAQPILANVDGWVEHWEATHGETDAPPRRQCLAAQARTFEAALEMITGSNADPKLSPSRIITSLPVPELCAMAPTECIVGSESAEASIALVRSAALLEGGDIAAASELLEALVLDTEVHRQPLAHARSVYWLGRARALEGSAEARSLVERAYEDASRCRDDQTATLAAIQMVWLLGADRLEPGFVEHWVRQARTALERAPNPTHEVWLLRGVAASASLSGEHTKAVETIEQARGVVERALDLESHVGASVLSDEATIRVVSGDLEGAAALHRRALAVRRKLLPAGHPDVGTSLIGLAQIATNQGQHDEAVVLLEQARDEYDRSIGEHHVYSVLLLLNLVDAHLEADQPKRALEPARAAVEQAKTHSLGQEMLARCRYALGLVLTALGEDEEAQQVFNRAAIGVPPTAAPALVRAIEEQLNAVNDRTGR